MTNIKSAIDTRDRSFGVLADVGKGLYVQGLITDMKVHCEHDLHGFYQFGRDVRFRATGDKVISAVTLHLQLYPRMSDAESMRFMSRFMSTEKLAAIRALPNAPLIGNEHKAVVAPLFDGYQADSHRLPWGHEDIVAQLNNLVLDEADSDID